MRVGYHCSHEQFSPAALVRYAQMAERAGFRAIISSDHFRPWSRSQGESGFVWSWLGAAMQMTGLPFGTLCIRADGDSFPDRLPWIAAGSGEALNESVTAQDWPEKEERRRRQGAAVAVMRALWQGETVDVPGPVPTRQARLYTLPSSPIAVMAPALTPETARRAGAWADGLINVNASRDKLREMIDAFREGGGAGKPAYLQVPISWGMNEIDARMEARRQWRFTCVDLCGPPNWKGRRISSGQRSR